MYYFEAEAARAMDEMGIRGIAGETRMEEEPVILKTRMRRFPMGRAS